MRVFHGKNLFFLFSFVIVAVFCGICAASGMEPDGPAARYHFPFTDEIDNRLKKAAELISKQSYKDAENILLDMEGSDTPEKGKVCFLLGRLYKEEGSFDRAETFLKKAADVSPLLRDYALKLLLDVYSSDGKFEDVIGTAGQIKNRLLAQYVKQSEVKAMIALKRDEEAEDILSQYIDDYPSDWDYKFTLAMLLKGNGKTVSAIRLLKEIYINAVPLSHSALTELRLLQADTFTKSEILKRADMLYEKNNFQRAEMEYQNALKLADAAERDRIRFAIGMCQFRAKQYSRASQSFGQVKTPEALYYRGWSFHRMDDREGFEKVKEEFDNYYPDDEKLALLLLMEAEEYRREGRLEEAGRSYRKVIDSFPTKKEDALWGTAWMHYTSGNYRAARQYFSQLASYEKSDNYFKYLYWEARTRENAARECLKQKASAQSVDTEKCDGEGSDFFSGLPADRSFYGYLIKMRSPEPVPSVKIEMSMPAKPEGETYDRIEALALLGMREEAVNEIIDFLRRSRNKNDFLYLGGIAMELGEYRKIIALAEKEADREFLLYSFPVGFDDIIEKAAESQEVDKYLVAAVIREESRFDPDAISWAGAMGLMQLMPATAYRLKKSLNVHIKDRSEIHDVQKNIMLGTHYLSNLLHEFRDIPLALAAYNAGENALKRWLGQYKKSDLVEFIENIPYRETRFYVKKVLRSYWQYRTINGLSLEGSHISAQGKS
jgi:soluble lytic murein transglycosylase